MDILQADRGLRPAVFGMQGLHSKATYAGIETPGVRIQGERTMQMKPMYFGEDALITLPSGEQITIFLSAHRSSRNEPIIGFKTPPGTTVRRQRMQKYLEVFLQQVSIFSIGCEGKDDMLIVAAREDQARRRYRQRYPDRGPLQVQVMEGSDRQPLSGYGWYSQLQKLYDCQTPVPFFIDLDP